MNFKHFAIITLFSLLSVTVVRAEVTEAVKDTTWLTGGSIGLDLSQLALFNPAIGSGENKLAFGGLTNVFANYAKDKVSWDTEGSFQLGVQRLGSADNPFTKNLDLLRINSKAGYNFSKKMSAAIVATFESLLLPTYDDLSLTSTGDNSLQARFLSPASFILAPGINYKHDKYLSLFVAPFAYKTVMVLDDEIAALGVHGNPWTDADNFENVKHKLGAHLKAKYNRVYFEKMSVVSELNLYYDYLGDEHGLEFMDVICINELGYELVKGLSLNILFDVRWDRNVASVLPEGEMPDGLKEFKKWMIREAFVVKYSYILK